MMRCRYHYLHKLDGGLVENRLEDGFLRREVMIDGALRDGRRGCNLVHGRGSEPLATKEIGRCDKDRASGCFSSFGLGRHGSLISREKRWWLLTYRPAVG